MADGNVGRSIQERTPHDENLLTNHSNSHHSNSTLKSTIANGTNPSLHDDEATGKHFPLSNGNVKHDTSNDALHSTHLTSTNKPTSHKSFSKERGLKNTENASTFSSHLHDDLSQNLRDDERLEMRLKSKNNDRQPAAVTLYMNTTVSSVPSYDGNKSVSAKEKPKVVKRPTKKPTAISVPPVKLTTIPTPVIPSTMTRSETFDDDSTGFAESDFSYPTVQDCKKYYSLTSLANENGTYDDDSLDHYDQDEIFSDIVNGAENGTLSPNSAPSPVSDFSRVPWDLASPVTPKVLVRLCKT